MSLAHLYHVPYSGNIERITESRANALTVPENDTYFDQMHRLGHPKSDFVRSPAIGGALIVRCPASEVQSIYDDVFGEIAHNKKTSNVVHFVQSPQQSALQAMFSQSAEKFRMGIDFPRAAAMPKADNESFTLERTLEAA